MQHFFFKKHPKEQQLLPTRRFIRLRLERVLPDEAASKTPVVGRAAGDGGDHDPLRARGREGVCFGVQVRAFLPRTFLSRSPLQQPSLFFPNPDPATFDSPPVASFCSIPRSSGLSSTHSDANPVVSLAVQGFPVELSRQRPLSSLRRPLRRRSLQPVSPVRFAGHSPPLCACL